MRLWTLHPRHLDARGLVALWREGLLAQAVLRGRTKGYKSHPQLIRFQAQTHPVRAIATYLRAVCDEAEARGYSFDARKIARSPAGARRVRMRETRGQLLYEWTHLKRKLRKRSPKDYQRALRDGSPSPHPSFTLVAGGVQEWEKVTPPTPMPPPRARKS